MAKYLAYGTLKHNSQGPNTIQELVQHFESNVSHEALQIEMNSWLLLIATDAVVSRPSIRNITYQILQKVGPPEIIYFAQVHYLLTGDDNQPV